MQRPVVGSAYVSGSVGRSHGEFKASSNGRPEPLGDGWRRFAMADNPCISKGRQAGAEGGAEFVSLGPRFESGRWLQEIKHLGPGSSGAFVYSPPTVPESPVYRRRSS